MVHRKISRGISWRLRSSLSLQVRHIRNTVIIVQYINPETDMDIVIDRASPLPLHFQIQQEIEHRIGEGALPPGMKLPTVQDMATRHSLSTHTVMRAYSSLCKKGFLTSSRRRGTFVAELKASTTVIVLPPWMEAGTDGFSGQLFQDLLNGVRRAFGESGRRFSHLKVEGGHYEVREIIEMCELHRADSVVILDPSLQGHQDLPILAQRIPVVGLLCRDRYAEMLDSVDVDATGALRTVLARRLAAGVTNFAYLGFDSLLETQGHPTIYQDLYDTFCETIRSAGIEPQILIVSSKTIPERNAALAACASTIPLDCTVLTVAPSVIRAVDPDPRLDVISYTEIYETKLTFAGRATLLYAHLPDAIAEATSMLADRRKGRSGPPRQVLTPLEILDLK